MEKIFIQIASYRDNQLKYTIKDCIENASNPENLVFCVAWQHSEEDEWDNLDEYKEDERFKIIDIDYKKSEGVCWARNKIAREYGGEKYTLQLDSHHRFVKGWDNELKDMIKQLQNEGYNKPLLTAYLPSFDPVKDPQERVQYPWKMDFDRFTPEGVIFFLPSKLEMSESLTCPIRCRFYSAHFCFTLGEFCKEVPHDPNYYFHGEEISIAVRAFTNGYDLFTPHKLIAWHEYTRKYRKKHWDDHKNWDEINKKSHIRLKKLLNIDGIENDLDFGEYGLGSVRTLQDYEKYAGINFKSRGVQQHTLSNKLPPNPQLDDPLLYEKSFKNIFKHCINIHTSQVPYNDYKFWAVIFEDETGKSLFREDLSSEDIKKLDNSDNFYKIWKTFEYVKKPYKYIVWPYSEKHEWCNKIEEIIYKY